MNKINVQEIIDNATFNKFHWRVLFWCALIIIFDGYDLVIYGTVLPKLMAEWNLTPAQAGSLQSYALFGMMLGAALLTWKRPFEQNFFAFALPAVIGAIAVFFVSKKATD